MELYNGLIQTTKELLAATPFQAWAYDPAGAWEDAGANELVLGRDAAYELGGGSHAAVSFTCPMGGPAGSDRVLLYGPDLGDIKADCSYARIALLRVRDLGADEEAAYRAIRDMEFVKYHVFPKGFMMRLAASTSREQVRVSRRALGAGISFRAVGFDFIQKYKQNPNVEGVELLFVTDPGVDYQALAQTARRAAEVTRALTHILEGIAMDCAACQLKPVCDEVEGMRALHFKQNRPK